MSYNMVHLYSTVKHNLVHCFKIIWFSINRTTSPEVISFDCSMCGKFGCIIMVEHISRLQPDCRYLWKSNWFGLGSTDNRVFRFKGYALVRPFLYFDHFHIFDLFCTSTALLQPLLWPLYCDSLTSTFCQIWTSYWSRSSGRSTVLVEVKFWSKYSLAKKVEVRFSSNFEVTLRSK
mgnify:CR=1 FL=1